jgi:hypothetical protein
MSAIRIRNPAPALMALLVLSACATLRPGPATPPMPSCPHVPPPPTEKPPPRPNSALPQILQPGHWEWDTSGYVWHQPHWQTRLTKRSAPWLDGYWAPNGGACVWHNGRFLYGAPQK